jgi:diaminopimelate epimerase
VSDGLRVEKYHGTGNDFVVVPADAPVADRVAFTARHCDRETGIAHPDAERTGADGVLFLDCEADRREASGTRAATSGSREGVDGSTDPPRVGMTHVQPDGSVAEMCGNGVRCAALWAARELGVGVDAPADLVVVTPAGDRPATVEDPPDGTATVTVDMGRPSFAAVDVPLAADRTEPLFEESVAGLTVSAVNTGVPHAVAFVEDVDAVDLEAVAPPVRHADVFPEGTNVVLAAPDGAGGFDQRTYERGVEGETDACGTGAVAVAAVARRRGLLNEDWVAVRPPGGALSVRVRPGGSFLRGPAEREFATTLAVEP